MMSSSYLHMSSFTHVQCIRAWKKNNRWTLSDMARRVRLVPLEGAATSVQSCAQSHIKEKLDLITHACPTAALGNSQPEEDLSENTCCFLSHWELHSSCLSFNYVFLSDAEINYLHRSSHSLCVSDFTGPLQPIKSNTFLSSTLFFLYLIA